MTDARDSGAAGFEDGMRALEAIVSRLESGQLTLEEALQAFEQGIGLVRSLNDKLNEAERRLEVLSRAEDGSLRLRAGREEKR